MTTIADILDLIEPRHAGTKVVIDVATADLVLIEKDYGQEVARMPIELKQPPAPEVKPKKKRKPRKSKLVETPPKKKGILSTLIGD